MKLKLRKVSDDKFKGEVEIPIPAGTVRVVDYSGFPMPKVGYTYLFGTLLTTRIEELLIVEEGYIKFRTENSTYELTYE